MTLKMGVITLIKDGGMGEFCDLTLFNQFKSLFLLSVGGEKKNFVYTMRKSKFYEIH